MNNSYYGNVNPDLLRFMPPDAKVILECGCGEGQLGRAYKDRNPDVFYIGMELNPKAAATARKYLDLVIEGDLEGSTCAEQIVAKVQAVDCIVYGDVLEHLRDPWLVLKEHSRLLHENGQVIACIPNVQHWQLLVNLLKGQWEYQDEGLLDRTHLRFFTLDSIKQLFQQATLTIFDIVPRIFEHPHRQGVQEALWKTAQALGVESQQAFAVQTGALQYVVRALKKPQSDRLLLHSLLGETKVCSRVRIGEPHAFCLTKPGVRVKHDIDTVVWPPPIQGEKKVFIWQRVAVQSFAQQEELLRRKYLIVYEMDDDPDRWEKLYKDNGYMAFRSCHAVQVSTEALAEFIRPYNPHVKVFENQLAVLPPWQGKIKKEQVHLFFGALNRKHDWLPIMGKLNSVLEKTPHQLTVVHDREFFEALETQHKRFVPFCEYGQYMQLLRQADVALLPLEENRFNSMKSDLKFLECAANGVVCLASPTVYEKSIRQGETGLIYHNLEEFEEKLQLVMREHSLREEIALRAYAWVKENRLLARHYQERLSWYAVLWGQYDQLTEELFQRMK